MTLENYFAELADQNKTITVLRLTRLSDLTPEEVKFLRQAWVEIDVERRRQIMHQIAKLAGSHAKLNFDSVFQACLRDSDAVVRAKAIQGLWECDDCSLITNLIELLERDESKLVRAAAAGALGKFALLAELRKVHPRYLITITQSLLNVIDSKREAVEVRCRAIEAIAPLSISRVKDVIYAAYRSKNLKLRSSAICAMGRSCDPLWLPILLRELSSVDPEMRFEAARACGELGEEEAAPHLIKLIRDSDIHVQLAATKALGRIRGIEEKQAFYRYLPQPDEQASQMVEEAWHELEAEEDSPFFELR